MSINLLNIIVGIIAGVSTIIQIIKGFFKQETQAKIQQNNKSGNNTFTDNTVTIKNTNNTTTINYPLSHSSSNNDVWITLIIGSLILGIMLMIYSITHKIVPILCSSLLVISIFKDTKVSFENVKAKVQWAIKNIIVFIIIIILLFTPRSITDTIEQLPALNHDSSIQ